MSAAIAILIFEQSYGAGKDSERCSSPDAYAVANMWYAHEDENNPARKLRDKVESMEREIKERYKVQTVTKKIIIDESEEKEEL